MKHTLNVAFFVVGNLLGAGFFFMPSAVACLGSNLVWSWLIGGALAFLFAMIFVRLGQFYPNVQDLTDYFDNIHLKKIIAVFYWLSIVIGNVVVLLVINKILGLTSFWQICFVHLSVLGLLFCLNAFLDEDTVILLDTCVSFLKFVLLFLLPCVLVFFLPGTFHVPSAKGSYFEILDIAILSFWSFVGIETACVLDRRYSQGQIRTGLVLGISLCLVLYILSCFLVVGYLPHLSALDGIPLLLLVQASDLNYLTGVVKGLIIFTSVASLFGWFFTTSKMTYSFAQKQLFPSVFLIQAKSNISLYGLVLSLVCSFLGLCVVIGFETQSQFDIVADCCVNLVLIVFGLCANVLRKKSLDRGFPYIAMFMMLVLLQKPYILFYLCLFYFFF